MTSKSIIFDLGNVIVKFDHQLAVKRIARFSDKTNEQIHKIIFASSIIRDFEKGEISPNDFFDDLKSMLNLRKLDFLKFIPLWNEIFFKNKEVNDIIHRLKENGYKIIVISNVNQLHLDYVMAKFKILKEVDKFVASCEVGYRKPQPQIYQIAINYAKESPQNLIYIDDVPELVEGARGVGLCAIQFKDAHQLKQDLIDQGLSCLRSR